MSDSPAKKIVIVSSWPLSEPVVRNRITPFFNMLLQAGYDVRLVCPENAGNKSQMPPGVSLHEVPLAHDRPRGFISRAIREARDVLLLLKHAKKIKADAWLLTIPSMFLLFLAPLALTGRKVVLDVRDLTWEYLSEEKMLQRISKRVFRFGFKRSLNFFRAVAVTNTTELAYVRKIWRGNIAPVLVSNGITREQFDKLANLEVPQARTVSVGYIGNIGLAQQLDTLLGAAKLLPHVSFKVIGAGTDYDRISSLVAEQEIDNVSLLGRVSWEDVREHYNQIDILYAQLAPDYSGAMPSKLYEYLATGKYVIYGGQGQAVEVLASFDHHHLIPPCDVQAFVVAIETYINDRSKKGLSQTNREKVRSDYIREDAAKKLVECMNEVVLTEAGTPAIGDVRTLK